MNGMLLREALLYRGFKQVEEAWVGPSGCVISDQFIVDCDDFHTSEVQIQVLAAVDDGAKHVCAIIAETRPYKVEIYYRK